MAAPFRPKAPPPPPPARAAEPSRVARGTAPTRAPVTASTPAFAASTGPLGALTVPSVGMGVKLGAEAQTDARFRKLLENLNKGAPSLPTPAPGATGGGEPLPPAVQRTLASTLQADLSSVRVHSETGARSAVKSVSARAMTYGSHIFLGPGERPTDVALMAHEAAHVVQQRGAPTPQRWSADEGGAHEREARRASEAALRGEPFQVREQTSGFRMQGLFGISTNPLDILADKANVLPGFRMLTVVLGVNPINMSRVERSPANVLRAVVELIPGGALITQALNTHGVFDRAGTWVEQQLKTLGMSAGSLKEAVDRFIHTLGPSDIFHPGDVWERAKSIFTEPINRITSFVHGLVGGITGIVKDAILRPLAKLAEDTRGYDLLKAVLGKDPITGEAVPRNAETLIGGFMKLIGQEEVWENLKKANAVGRAWTWFQGALSGLLGFVRSIPELFMRTLKSLEIADIVLLPRAFAKVKNAFGDFIGRFMSWAGNTVWDLMEIIFSAVAAGVMPYLRKARDAFRALLRDPVGFLRSLLGAVKQGFGNFVGNIWSHLKTGFMTWLFGALEKAGIPIPKDLGLPSLLKLALDVMGLTPALIRSKAAKLLGERNVAMLEKLFSLVQDFVVGGPEKLWERLKEYLSDLKEQVLGALQNWLATTVIGQAVKKLVLMFNPAGAVIQAFITIYDTVMFFIEQAKQLGALVESMLGSVYAIASGAIGGAAKLIEQSLARAIPLAIDFLARFLKLGGMSAKIRELITKAQKKVDEAIDKLLAKIVAAVKKLFGKDGKGTKAGVASGKLELPLSMAGATHTLFITLGAGASVEMNSKRDLLSNKIGRAVGVLIQRQRDTEDPVLAKKLKQQADDLNAIWVSAKEAQNKLKELGADNPALKTQMAPVIESLKSYARTHEVKDVEDILVSEFPEPKVGPYGGFKNRKERLPDNHIREPHHAPPVRLALSLQEELRQAGVALNREAKASGNESLKGSGDSLLKAAERLTSAVSQHGSKLPAILIHEQTHRRAGGPGISIHGGEMRDQLMAELNQKSISFKTLTLQQGKIKGESPLAVKAGKKAFGRQFEAIAREVSDTSFKSVHETFKHQTELIVARIYEKVEIQSLSAVEIAVRASVLDGPLDKRNKKLDKLRQLARQEWLHKLLASLFK